MKKNPEGGNKLCHTKSQTLVSLAVLVQQNAPLRLFPKATSMLLMRMLASSAVLVQTLAP